MLPCLLCTLFEKIYKCLCLIPTVSDAATVEELKNDAAKNEGSEKDATKDEKEAALRATKTGLQLMALISGGHNGEQKSLCPPGYWC